VTEPADTSGEPPGVCRRDVVLVLGPHLAGSSSLLVALQKLLPDNTFVEPEELSDDGAPAAVVFVVSAVAPVTPSDCALLEAAAAHTDVVIGVVTKIDVHRRWRDVLEADRRIVAAHAERYAAMPWVGVAAAPDLGDVQLAPLVDALGAAGIDESVRQRNRLRAWQFRTTSAAVERQARVTALTERRVELGRRRRMAKAAGVIALRSQIQQARTQLCYSARSRCAVLRAELQDEIATLSRRTMPGFCTKAGRRVAAVLADVDREIAEQLVDIANALDLHNDSLPAAQGGVDIGTPPLRTRRVETRLMMLLGTGFGAGVALTLSRIFADLAPGLAVLGAAVCVVVGLALSVWVVGMRGLLHDRAVLDRWVGGVTAALRATADQRVATGVLAAETALSVRLAEQDEIRAAAYARQLSALDAELRTELPRPAQRGRTLVE
jgi:hypothetical protein